ncbi:outer membrane lipoprotein [Klebsiella pneumoniae]|uniref:Outer membrane lipoprotein n=1 Tax=Klebsiella pneumoniae TaxID=573 RepID=A0A377WMH8_KLEPN|nr:outer membrane lipoprotein [Klebsiella pneumoniae]
MRTIIVIASLLLTGCSHMANDAWSGQDKAQHFLASAMLSAAGNEYAQHQGYSRDRSAAIGLMFSVSLGASKRALGQPPGWERLELEGFCLGCRRRDHRLRCMGSWLISKRYRRNPFPLRCNIRETRKAMAAITVTYQ